MVWLVLLLLGCPRSDTDVPPDTDVPTDSDTDQVDTDETDVPGPPCGGACETGTVCVDAECLSCLPGLVVQFASSPGVVALPAAPVANGFEESRLSMRPVVLSLGDSLPIGGLTVTAGPSSPAMKSPGSRLPSCPKS